ncbi:MAG: 50S ribosomal protein L11 methyltransferase [Anaerolineae bacterium]
MNWLEFSVTTESEATDAVVELFERCGWSQVVLEVPIDCFEYELEATPATVVIVKAYRPLDGDTQEARRRLEEGLWHLQQINPNIKPAVRELAESDWAEAWKDQYHLLRIGRRVVIAPAWEAYEPGDDEAVIRLEPGMAFGTGLHPTTRLCLAALEDLAPDRTVLDVGTGSGVLAIAATKLGARAVLAVDADPVAVRVAKDNVALNGVASQVEVRHGSLPGTPVEDLPARFRVDGQLELLEMGHFDLVLVNILAPVIVAMAPALAARLHPAGWLVAAGLIEVQETEVTAALAAQGLKVVDRYQEADWIALVAQRG